jgi:two-component system sensor histidine kinase KdpD
VRSRSASDARAAILALGALAAAVVGLRAFAVGSPTIVSLTLLTVVLGAAAIATRRVAVAVSIAAMAAFNFFFLPPVGTWTIADPQNWVALFVFLAVSLVGSHLSAVARARAAEAMERRDELNRLFDLSRDVMVMTDSPEAMTTLARSMARRFDLAFVAVAVPRGDVWSVAPAGAVTVPLDPDALSEALAAARSTLEFDAHARAYAGHRTIVAGGETVRLVPLRAGTRPIGLLAAAGRPIEAGTLDAIAGVVAIAIERAEMLEAHREAAMTRQRDELKTALLASLGHDLRTPLTAIRVAADNLRAEWATPEERREQHDVILTEVERLTRLFENVLEMARIDAGAVRTEARAAHPSEIVAAARDQVELALRQHRIDVDIDPDEPVTLDPRLTAAAMAHVLENAAQYAPAGSTIDVRCRRTGEGLVLTVADRGSGIAAVDLPHVFDRFYRGAGAQARTAGTGMGLWIARHLLAVQRGRIWVENRAGGGAEFTILVPAVAVAAEAASS